jgi:hypothetical protein
MALQPIRIFDGSFHGATLYENPAFVSPNLLRRMVKQRAAGKYNSKVRGWAAAAGTGPGAAGPGTAGGLLASAWWCGPKKPAGPPAHRLAARCCMIGLIFNCLKLS